MKDFVIIGGGFAGLSAGYHLSHAGKTFVLLEARERLGGRTETVTLQDGSAVDLGGQWIGPGHDRIYRLSKELQVAIFPTFNEGKHFFEDDAKKHIFAGPVPKLDFWSLRKLTRAMAKLDQLASEINILHPWLSSNARTLDSQTLQTWLDVNLTNEPAKRVLSTALMQLLAIEPNRVSLLHLLFYIRSGKNLTYLVSMAGGAQQDRFVAGTEALANKLAEGFRESIRLASPVLSIQQDADGVTAITASGTIKARRAIVALPPLLAGRIAYSPALAAERDQLTQCAPMGSIIKCMALYRTPFWRARGLSGQTFSTSGILISTCDNSPADGQSGILVGLIAGANAEKLRRLSAAERRQTIVVELRQWFGEQAGEPLQYVDRCWEADQWSRGGYFGCFTPGALTAFGEALRKPSGRIHWAGAETAREWLGFIEGAIESGERTAAEVLEADGV